MHLLPSSIRTLRRLRKVLSMPAPLTMEVSLSKLHPTLTPWEEEDLQPTRTIALLLPSSTQTRRRSSELPSQRPPLLIAAPLFQLHLIPTTGDQRWLQPTPMITPLLPWSIPPLRRSTELRSLPVPLTFMTDLLFLLRICLTTGKHLHQQDPWNLLWVLISTTRTLHSQR